MITKNTIENLNKLSYIDEAKAVRFFRVKLIYDNFKKSKKISKRLNGKQIKKILDEIKEEVGYKNDETREDLPFAFS